MIEKLISQLCLVPFALPLSYSKVSCLLRCPRQFDLRYRKKDKGIAPDSQGDMDVGKYVHTVLENLVIRGKSFGYSYDTNPFEVSWGLAKHTIKVPEGYQEKLRSLKADTKEVGSRVFSSIPKYGLSPHPEYQICLGKDLSLRPAMAWPQRFFFGYIDFMGLNRRTGSALLLDYKSHEQTDGASKEAQVQLGTYAAALLLGNPKIESVQAGCVYIPNSNFALAPPILRGSPEAIKTLSIFDNFILEYLQALQKEDTTPKPTRFCKWCNFITSCPEGIDGQS